MIGIIRGIITLVLMFLFIALVLWAWSGRRKAQFNEAAQLPLEDEPKEASRNTQS